jgi:sec-independent protein translocase protein TatB
VLGTVFGFSFSELVVVIIVALVVLGPKDLPKMLRRLGQWAGKIRRLAADLRAQSGIDEALRSEGLADDIAEIRKLARGELDAVRVAATITEDSSRSNETAYNERGDDFYVVRDREYPRDGADAYGALPDNAIVYAEGLPKSPLARDPLYVMGDENAELPPEPEPAGAAGPTLMGIGAADVAASEQTGNDGGGAKEAESAKNGGGSRANDGAAGPTLMGVGVPLQPEKQQEPAAQRGDERPQEAR